MPRRRNVDHHLKERRERKYRLQNRTHRFIPPKDSDFACMGRQFANHVAGHAERLGVPPEKVEELRSAVAAFRDALARSLNRNTAGPKATFEKNEARKEAEKLVRATARMVRGVAEEKLTGVDRMELNMPARPKRNKPVECPLVAPILRFVGSIGPHGMPANQGDGLRHVLEYSNDFDYKSSAKPRGAARLELFVELVPVGQPIPVHPGQRSGGRYWFLRSFTTSRFEVDFPVMMGDDGRTVPMLVVYWGRWADACGGAGPFSQTCVARVEGGATEHGLPGTQCERIRVTRVMEQCEAKFVVIQPRALPSSREGFEESRLCDERLLPQMQRE